MRAPPSLLLLAVVCVLGSAARRPGVQYRLTAEVMELRECDASSAVRVANWTQRRSASGDILVTVALLVARSTPKVSSSMASFTKCSEYGANCEKVVSLPGGARPCTLWNMEGVPWTPVRKSILSAEPPHRPAACPPKEGLYVANNTSFDFDSAARMCPFPLQDGVWSIETRMWGADRRLFVCMMVKSRLIRWAARP